MLNATHTFFTKNTDPKAQIITTIEGGALGNSMIVLFFYDGTIQPSIFHAFDGISSLIDLRKNQTFGDFVNGVNSHLIHNDRGTFNTLSTSRLTPGFLAAVKNETTFWTAQMLLHGGTSVSYDVEPFLPTWGQYATDSAYPHADSPLPLNLYWAWSGAENDAFWYDAMHTSVNTLAAVAKAEGILPADYTRYPNYAISGTTATQLYGAKNAAKLKKIKQQIDPTNIMGHTGGFDLLA